MKARKRENTALIVVDVQNDFMPGGALAVPRGGEVVPVINRLMTQFNPVVATQDWHPSDHLSFASNHPGRRVGEVIPLNDLDQILWPVHCVQHTPGARFVPALNTECFTAVFQKGIDREFDSYSGLYDNGHRRATGMGDFLQERQVERVYIAGLATDYCVKFTALDAVGLRFRTWVVEDACRGVNLRPGDVPKALEDMRRHGINIVQSTELPAGGRID